eukprot:scaffold7184_cov82-Cylindrotheca_fusiformis.AAC.2
MEVCTIYKAHGFRVVTMHADNEFEELLRLKLLNKKIHLETCAPDEHVPDVERAIQTIKDRNRTMVVGLRYKRYPCLLKREIVKQAAISMNLLPHPDGISQDFSPRTLLVTGRHVNFDVDLRVPPIGSYCEVHDHPAITNTETERNTTTAQGFRQKKREQARRKKERAKETLVTD